MSVRSNILLVLLTSLASATLTSCGGVSGGDLIIEPGNWPWPNQAEFVATETFSETVPAAARTRVLLNAVNGEIDVTGSAEATSVTVTAVLQVGSRVSLSDANAGLLELDVRITDSGDEILVRTVQPSNPQDRQYAVYFNLTVPADMDVDINQVNGSVRLAGTGGSVVANLINGSIESTLGQPPTGEVRLLTVNGNLDLRIPTLTSATFSAIADNGTIRVDDLELDNPISTNRSITGVLGSGTGEIRLETTNGSIVVTGFDG